MGANRTDQAARVEAYRASGYNVSAAARSLGIARKSMQDSLRTAQTDGILTDEEMREANAPAAEKFHSARSRLLKAHQAKRAKGDWKKANSVYIGPGPFMLGLFGDKHMDNPGCDLDMLLRDWDRINPQERVFGLFLGDEFDNWPRAMGHLWKDNPVDPSDAWEVYHHMLVERPGVLALVTGNHDQFTSAPIDPLQLVCEDAGVIYRRSGMHLEIQTGDDAPITIAARHIWRGNSMYSSAHALKKAALHNHTDADIIAGAHIHQGENRRHVRSHDGRVTILAQVSSYKILDNYANDRGFMSEPTPPCVWCVCDPSRPVTDHGRVTEFYDFDLASKFLRAL
jgi:transposase-like protein